MTEETSKRVKIIFGLGLIVILLAALIFFTSLNKTPPSSTNVRYQIPTIEPTPVLSLDEQAEKVDATIPDEDIADIQKDIEQL